MSNKIIVKDHKYYFKIRGLGGPKGDKGDTGPAGPQGPQGPYVNVQAGNTTTLPAGSSAQVTVNNVGNTSVLNFGIPQGFKGDKGDKGATGSTGPQGPQGPQGNTGPAGLNATVTVGTTTTGAPGSNANVTNSGTGNQAVLNFTIPQGAKGDVGPQGQAGPQGPIGPQGPRGYTGGIKSTVVSELPETGQGDTYYLVNRTAEEHTATTTDGYVQITNTENAGDLTLTKLNGNAEQKTLSGKNLADLVPMTNGTITGINQTTVETVNDSTLGRQVIHETATGAYPTAKYNLPARLESGKYYALTLRYKTAYTGTGAIDQQQLWVAPAWSGNNWDTLNSWRDGRSKDQNGAEETFIQPSTSWTVKTFRFYVDPEQYSSVSSSYTAICLSLGRGLSTQNTSKEAWFADIMICEISQEEWNATTYADSDFQEYCGGIPSPNPDYPQDIKTVSGLQTVKITGKNIFDDATLYHGYYIPTAPYGKLADEKYRTAEIELKAGTYTFSCDLENCYMLRLFADGENITIDTAKNSHTFTTTTNGTVMICFRNTSTSTITQDVKCQIELGSTATAYEPYQSQSQEINLGKNLFDTDTAVTRFEAYNGNVIPDWGTYSDGIVTIVKSNGAHGTCAFAGFKPKFVEGQTYTLSAKVYLEGTNASKQLRFGTVTNSNSPITIASKDEWLTVVKTFTATASDVSDPRIDIQAYNTGNTVQIKEIQLEAGSRATPYSAYKTPIELAKIGTYQDYIWNDDGTWKIHKEVGKMVLDGVTESWQTASTASKYIVVSDALGTSNSRPMSDHFIYASSGSFGTFRFGASNQNLLFADIIGTEFQTLADFKIWLGSHNVAVYYELATPTDTEITDSELIEQLNHIYSLYQGQNNLWLIPNAGAQGEFTGDYVLYDKYNQHQVYIWSSDDSTWQIILP